MTMNQPSAVAIAGAAAVVLGLAAPACAGFTGGPSVRVAPDPITPGLDKIHIRWIADFVGNGKVEIFDNPDDATGNLIASNVTPTSGNDHTIVFNVGGAIQPDTKYHFKIIHKDPNGNLPDLTNPTPLPPVFTGVQAISGVSVVPGIDSAVISWDANVIGFGQIAFGTATPGDLGTLTDNLNTTNHAIELTGLSPGTTYKFRVSNLHAIELDSLASEEGEFTTTGTTPTTVVNLVQPRAEPRVIEPNEVSTLSVVAKAGGTAVSGIVVKFEIEPDSGGSGAFNGSATAEATTNASGIASVQLKATDRGNVRVKATSANARNSVTIVVVVPSN